MKLNAIIVEDEQASREILKNYLKKYCPNVNVVGEADSAVSALDVISKQKPDLVFLDIAMPLGGGFQLLESLDVINFDIIFVYLMIY